MRLHAGPVCRVVGGLSLALACASLGQRLESVDAPDPPADMLAADETADAPPPTAAQRPRPQAATARAAAPLGGGACNTPPCGALLATSGFDLYGAGMLPVSGADGGHDGSAVASGAAAAAPQVVARAGQGSAPRAGAGQGTPHSPRAAPGYRTPARSGIPSHPATPHGPGSVSLEPIITALLSRDPAAAAPTGDPEAERQPQAATPSGDGAPSAAAPEADASDPTTAPDGRLPGSATPGSTMPDGTAAPSKRGNLGPDKPSGRATAPMASPPSALLPNAARPGADLPAEPASPIESPTTLPAGGPGGGAPGDGTPGSWPPHMTPGGAPVGMPGNAPGRTPTTWPEHRTPGEAPGNAPGDTLPGWLAPLPDGGHAPGSAPPIPVNPWLPLTGDVEPVVDRIAADEPGPGEPSRDPFTAPSIEAVRGPAGIDLAAVVAEPASPLLAALALICLAATARRQRR